MGSFPHPRHSGGSPERWNAGDMAECLHNGPWFSKMGLGPPLPGPVFSEVRVVTSVSAARHPLGGWVEMLEFARWPGHRWPARSFRKIVPRADAARAADAAFLRDMSDSAAPAPLPVHIEAGA